VTNSSPGITYTGGTGISVSGSTISAYYSATTYTSPGTYTIPAGITDVFINTNTFASPVFLNMPSTVVPGRDIYIYIHPNSTGRTIWTSDPDGIAGPVTIHVRGIGGTWALVGYLGS
jgi:hypothetical protein